MQSQRKTIHQDRLDVIFDTLQSTLESNLLDGSVIDFDTDMLIEQCTYIIENNDIENNHLISRIFLARSVAYQLQKKYINVLSDIDHALDISPNNTEIHNRLNRFFARYFQPILEQMKTVEDFINVGDAIVNLSPRRQIDLLDEVLDVNSNHFSRLNKKFGFDISYRNLEKYNYNLKLKHEFKLNPTSWLCFSRRANYYIKLEKYNSAISDYTSIIELIPGDKLTYKNRADAYSKTGQIALELADYFKFKEGSTYSLEDFIRILGILDQITNSHNLDGVNGSDIYNFIINMIDSIDLKTALLKKCLDKNYPFYAIMSEDILKKIEAQIKILSLDEVIQKQPSPENYRARANFYLYTIKDYDKAIKDYNEVIKLNSNDASVYFSRGESYFAKGCYESAISDFSYVIENRAWAWTPTPDAYKARGDACMAIQCYEHALADYNSAIKQDNHHCYFNRAKIHYIKKAFGKAILDYSRSIDVDSKEIQHQLELIFQDIKSMDSNYILQDITAAQLVDAIFLLSVEKRNEFLHLCLVKGNAFGNCLWGEVSRFTKEPHSDEKGQLFRVHVQLMQDQPGYVIPEPIHYLTKNQSTFYSGRLTQVEVEQVKNAKKKIYEYDSPKPNIMTFLDEETALEQCGSAISNQMSL